MINFDKILQQLFLYLETFDYFCIKLKQEMRYFETVFLEEADEFISTLNPKTIKKILYNIDLAEQTNSSKLFKKITDDIWEFRTSHFGIQIRLLAFWDISNRKTTTLVIATHGFIKKVDKVPKKEIERAKKIMVKYYNHQH